jgi:hypothetical protein
MEVSLMPKYNFAVVFSRWRLSECTYESLVLKVLQTLFWQSPSTSKEKHKIPVRIVSPRLGCHAVFKSNRGHIIHSFNLVLPLKRMFGAVVISVMFLRLFWNYCQINKFGNRLCGIWGRVL